MIPGTKAACFMMLCAKPVSHGDYMSDFISNFNDIWDKLVALFQSYNIITDTLDIALVAFLIYKCIKLIKETRAVQIVKGLVLIGIVYLLISLLNMQASTYIFKILFNDFIIILIVLFAPEIRHALETMGRSGLSIFEFFGDHSDKMTDRAKRAAMEISKACTDMSEKKIGALIVIEMNTMLGNVVSTGTKVDADVSKELLGTLFFPNSPLHDGAVVIRNAKVYAAGCILPLTEKNNFVSNELGTRHRASIGMSEQSDAVVVVVSEETGQLSIAHKGRLTRDISDGELIEKLLDYMVPKTKKQTINDKKTLWKSRKKAKHKSSTAESSNDGGKKETDDEK